MKLDYFTEGDLCTIRDSFLFAGISEEALCSVISCDGCDGYKYKKGDVIYSEADFRRSVGIVLSGRVSVSRDIGNGRQYLMNSITVSGIFGAAALFGNEDTYVTTITADEPSKIVFFSQELMEKMISEDSLVAKNYILFLSGRIKFLNRKIQGLTTVSTSQSLERFLITNMIYDSGEYYVDNVKSFSALAKMLNIGRASLYRGFDVLENDGIIKRDGKKIIITSPDRLMSK